MLPSSGLFKDIDCPHHDAICGRPYCHFRHRRKLIATDSAEDSADNSSSSNDVPTYKPTPKSQLASARGHLPISYVPDLVIRSERANRPPITIPEYTYKPTPKSILSSNVASDVAYVPTLVSKETAKDEEVVNNVIADVDNIDLEDLDTEFGIIDEILTDGSLVDTSVEVKEQTEKEEEKTIQTITTASATTATKQDLEKKSDDSKKKSSSTSTKHSKDKKHKERSKSSSSISKTKRKERDKSKEINHKERDKKTDNHKSKESEKDKCKTEEKQSSSNNTKNKDTEKDKSKTEEKQSSSNNTKSKDTEKDKSNTEKKQSSSKNSKHTKSSSSSKHKDREKGKDKHRSSSQHRKSTSKTTNKREKSKKPKENTLEENLQNLLNSEDNDDDNVEPMNHQPEFDLDDDLDDEPTLEEECYRIFNEYKPTPIAELEKNPIIPEPDEKYVPEDMATIGKKRVAYENAEKMTTNRIPPPMDRIKHVIPSPATAMINRIKQARLAQSNNEQMNIMNEINRQQDALKRPATTSTEIYTINREKIIKLDNKYKVNEIKLKPKAVETDLLHSTKMKNRIAHAPTPSTSSQPNIVDDILNGRAKSRKIAPVMNAGNIQKAKERVDQMNRAKAAQALAKTPSQTARGAQRVAHVPDYSLAELPDVTHVAKSKLPVNVRTRYLTLFAEEAVKLYVSREDAYQRAIGEEDKCYDRCSALPTYRNSAMLAINRLRKEVKEREASGLGPLLSAEEEDRARGAVEDDYHGKRLYGLLERYMLTGDDLELHGFPRESTEPGRALVKLKPSSIPSLPINQRACARCHKIYLIDKRGYPLYEEECIYHPLKKRTFRGDRNYLCCKSPDDTGCVTSNTHVSEICEDRVLLGYQTTLTPSSESDERSYCVYALDCEMCYTTIGLELTRVTIVDPDCKTVYESLVKPLNPILDYNTQFSGITREQMDRTSTSILQVQANILHLCNSRTLLIGHSLESDLKALKIIHSSVIDTSVMFPHKFGLPHKRALRALASDYLRKIIQNSVSGHDSAEDALTCMELVLWQVKEDLKVKGIGGKK